jgi:hypothetical protein
LDVSGYFWLFYASKYNLRKICEKQGRDFVFLLFVFTFAELAQTFALKLDGCFAG